MRRGFDEEAQGSECKSQTPALVSYQVDEMEGVRTYGRASRASASSWSWLLMKLQILLACFGGRRDEETRSSIQKRLDLL
jgi:hypothetical protein